MITTNEVYSKLADCLLALKAKGATNRQLEDGLILAAKEAGLKADDVSNAMYRHSFGAL